MEPESLEHRLAAMEARLTRLEALLTVSPESGATASLPVATADAEPVPAAASATRYGALPGARRRQDSRPAHPAGDSESSASFVTLLLGWGGAAALVLSAAYLIRLAIENGWLTPARQILLAIVAGVCMVVAGYRLRGVDRRYAGFLPAGGVVILFLSVYGAHHVYDLLATGPAAVAGILVCLLSLWLSRSFSSDLYALFAVAGSYAVPLLMTSAPSVAGMTGYFIAWAGVFGLFAVWQSRRQVYLLAATLGLLVLAWWFDGHPGAWQGVVALQALHVFLLALAGVTISLRLGQPLDLREARHHLPVLLLFYALQGDRWNVHAQAWLLPALALPGIVMAGLSWLVRRQTGRPAEGGEWLCWSWCAVWWVHGAYHEAATPAVQPWLAALAIPGVALIARLVARPPRLMAPLWLAAGVLFVLDLVELLLDEVPSSTVGRGVLLPLLAIQAWMGWWWLRDKPAMAWLALALGHVAAMGAVLDLVDTPILQSALWGLLALGWMAASWGLSALRPAQSALPVFACAALKVLLHDLAGAATLARIASLALLGVSFYAGGLFYQRLGARTANAPATYAAAT